MRRGRFLSMLMLAGLGAVPAAAQVPATLAGRVEANRVTHPDEPDVRVPAGAAYVGGERFPLYGVADCEIHLFASAPPRCGQ
jgi:hypothetical protein